ncbi:hypothetical protein [Streptomyces sp. C184]|uniref:hypothetical protein n=1 Tax=Streptomyces sp. C184 TaxID=3237121 RepID=UPI0034C66860
MYTHKNGVVTSILVATGFPRSVEVADRKLVMYETWDMPGYESGSVHAWDARRQVMTIQDVGYGRRTPASATHSGR